VTGPVLTIPFRRTTLAIKGIARTAPWRSGLVFDQRFVG
jgi:hypothetical protein